MPNFLLDNQFVEILDEHGQSRLIPFQQALEIEKNRIIAQERALGIQRK